MIDLKRVYEPPSTDDGFRILVERLWPRGLSKSRAQVDLWLKDIAPSPQLRTWYAHELARWEEFQRRYRAVGPSHAGRSGQRNCVRLPGRLTQPLARPAIRLPQPPLAPRAAQRLIDCDGAADARGIGRQVL
jgi:hypothetical protein